jgi:hypothetical protein
MQERINDMAESQFIFSKLKQQPQKLLQKRHLLEVQAHQLKQHILMLDENIEVTNKYIESEESTMKINQEQI